MKTCPKCEPSHIDRIEQIEKSIKLIQKSIDIHMQKISDEYKLYIKLHIENFEKGIAPYLEEFGKRDFREASFFSKINNLSEDLNKKLDRKINKFW